MDGTVREIKSIESEIKRINARKKELMQQKKRAQARIYSYMQRHGLEVYNGIRLKTITPRPKKKRVGIKQKREMAVEMLFRAGIPDPQGFWDNYQQAVQPKVVE